VTTLTVTATQGGGTSKGMLLRVKVLTGAALAASQAGAHIAVAAANSGSIITTVTGSVVYGALTNGGTSYTAEPLCTLIDNFADTVNTEQYGTFRTTSATGTPGSTLVGSSTAGGFDDIAAAEILAAGTITEDGSAPAVATTTALTALTTASFTPPPGSLIVVLIGSSGAANGTTSTTMAVTDTGGGLTWIPLAQAASTATCYAGVFIAQVPAATAAPAPPVPLPLQPPGWFPGADRVTTSPGAVPFTPQPGTTSAPPAVIFPPFPEAAATQQWLPWPPGYFPGSQAVTVDPGGVPFYAQPQPLLAPPPPPQVPYIAGLAGTPGPGWFTDQNGQPRLWVCDQMYGLVSNAGRWNGSGGGTYQQDYDRFFSARAAQGLTAVLVELVGSFPDGGVFDNGNTWDNVPPFNTGQDPASGLNPAYWARFDYLLNSALNNGITIFPIFDITYNSASGECLNGWTNAQYQAFGAALGARYKNQPNLMWMFGDDTFPTTYDTFFNFILTGLSGAGDTHPVTAMWLAEYTSRYNTTTNAQSAWGAAHSAFNSCYTYNAGYFCIEYAYSEVISEGASALLPVVWNNGYHFQGGASYDHTNDRSWRQEIWWCLTAGARGVTTYSHSNYLWNAAADVATVTSDWSFANCLNNVVSTYQSWPGWYRLLPDLSSSFVTAGRGSRVAGLTAGGGGGAYEPAFTNSWVTASITPDGTLAVCYLPNSTTITVSTALLATGWTATWIDPVTGGATSAGAGPTFNSTAKGNNSQGDPDWALVFQAPPLGSAAAPGLPDYLPQPPGWFPGSNAVQAEPGGIPFYVQPQPTDQNAAPPAAITITGTAAGAGAGSAAAVVTQAVIATAAAAGSVTAAATVISAATAAGAGAASAVATQIAPASSAGTGSAAGAVTQGAAGAAAGAGATAAIVTQAATAASGAAGAATANAVQAAAAGAAGAGAVVDVVTQIAGAAAAGAGSVTAAGASSGAATAAAAGAGSVTAVVTQIVPAAAAGAGAVTTTAVQGAGGTAAGAGTAGPAPVTQIAPATAAGASAVTDVVTQIAIASAAGAASVTATGTITGAGSTASAAGAGTVTALATQAATGTAAGAGSVTAAAVQAAKATAAGAGAATAAGYITGTASAAGAATATAKATQAAAAVSAGTGALAALAVQQAAAAITGAGAVTAAATVAAAFTAGALTASTAPGATLTASGAPAGVLTAAAASAALTGATSAAGGTAYAPVYGPDYGPQEGTLTATSTRTGGPS
jgi:hypothetical protein